MGLFHICCKPRDEEEKRKAEDNNYGETASFDSYMSNTADNKDGNADQGEDAALSKYQNE